MMAALEIIKPGIHTTVQDLGRIGYRDVGVPVSGPLDHLSFRLANGLVGNPQNTPALELLMLGPTLRVMAASVRVALAGSNAEIEIGEHGMRRVPAGRSVRIVRGEVFRVAALHGSHSAYLAVEGGLDLSPVLGSFSTYERGRIGGFLGRRLKQGDILPLKLDNVVFGNEYAMAGSLDLALERPIRVILGPQIEYFTSKAIEAFLSLDFRISLQSDRMGYRLDGPPLEHARGYNIVSDGIVTGSVQVPGSGKPIVLMVDNPTTGGYPKIATVISADIPLLGRRGHGATVHFQSIEVDEAHLLRKQQEEAFEKQYSAIRLTNLSHFRG